jgi:trehalose-6-phosphatase
MLDTAIIRAYQEKTQRKWDTLYFAIDLHGTIIKRYTGEIIEPYDHAKRVLQELTQMPDIVLILFTSTSQKNLKPFYNSDILMKIRNARIIKLVIFQKSFIITFS